jgi:hypothetical protein
MRNTKQANRISKIVTFSLYEADLAILEEWRRAARISNTSETLRQILAGLPRAEARR